MPPVARGRFKEFGLKYFPSWALLGLPGFCSIKIHGLSFDVSAGNDVRLPDIWISSDTDGSSAINN